jgi:alkylhydroperoxidase family enzyme
MVGLKPEEIADSRLGHSSNARTSAALKFAMKVLDYKGAINDADITDVRAAGFSDGEIAEIIAHVALNVLTNYFNLATEVEIDFPKVSFAKAALYGTAAEKLSL